MLIRGRSLIPKLGSPLKAFWRKISSERHARARRSLPTPPISELEFLNLSGNFKELSRKLRALGVPADAVDAQARHVCKCYLQLAYQHLEEAEGALSRPFARTVYSRAYYAAYSASKAARYFASGFVSLKGDDHKKAGVELPGDLDDLDSWSLLISDLREHRVRADYDNWHDTPANHTMAPDEALKRARNFVEAISRYLTEKHGISL
jgi:hypothetical protein